MRLTCLLSIFFAVSFAFAVPEDNVLVAALAKVGDQGAKTILTTRDLQINLFLSEFDSFLQDYEDKRDPLRELVWEELIYMEAKKILNQEISSRDISEFAGKFKKKLEQDKLWLGMSVDQAELSRAITRRLTARRLVNLKMGSKDLIYVSDEEIESYYVQNRNQLGQKQISEVHDAIKSGLQSQKAKGRFKDWIDAIIRTHGVAYYSGYKIQ